MLARLLTSFGSSRSSTERCCTLKTLSNPSMLSERLRFRKLEMCACLKPVCCASRIPVSCLAATRPHSTCRRLSCKALNFILWIISYCYKSANP